MRPHFTWNLGRRTLELGRRTLVMGVVNVTPDSFSDGGLHYPPDAALEHALALLEDGADIVDIGGESTRPGSSVGLDHTAVSIEEELRRVLPVVAGLRKQKPSAVISVDTYKSAVVRASVDAGADIINDVSGFEWDPAMRETVAGLTCGLILMHSRGRPDEWHSLAPVIDPTEMVKTELALRTEKAVTAGIARDRVVVDPGFGFGKRLEENFPLLRRFEEFHELGFPILAGVSRKAFLGRALARHGTDRPLGERQFGTLGAELALGSKGAHIIRSHDVRALADALRLVELATCSRAEGAPDSSV
jgi:dihydropteroate synthase